MGKETYKTKWDNQELSDFVHGRQRKAQQLRSDAATLVRRAEQIEEESYEWETLFVIVDDTAKSVKKPDPKDKP